MAALRKSKERWEFGDFQTPEVLAMQVADILRQMRIDPASIIEPTCGQGNLLISAIKTFPTAEKYVAADTNAAYLKQLENKLLDEQLDVDINILHADFFGMDWKSVVDDLPQPILIVGNPPWVTSTDLSQLHSSNLPEKSNFQGKSGLDALTGKSNFDISEWMLLQHLSWLQDKIGTIAMLCKTAVARKILTQAWRQNLHIGVARIYKVNAKKHFDASVDACLLIMQLDTRSENRGCSVFAKITDSAPQTTWGYHDGLLLSDMKTYQQLKRLRGQDRNYTWRSGIKHDCAKVMELSRNNGYYVDGQGIEHQLEDEYLYPLLKSSDIGNSRCTGREKYMLVTQKYVGQDTTKIRDSAPLTWKYLQGNRELLAKRGSSIYRDRPEFSIFGVGDYTFSPWKVAISGFYKRLNFVIIPPIEGKPTVFDDTVYFLSCASETEANFVLRLLESHAARDFLSSMVFWEDKRPITVELLRRLSLHALSVVLELEEEYLDIIRNRGVPDYSAQVTQLRLLEQGSKYES